MRKVGVGVIGAGNIGFFHLRGLQMVNVYGDYQADLVVLADCDEEAANRLGKRYGFKKITTNWEDVINDPEVEVVSVLTPNCEHAKMAIAAAKAGKHVMVEKPMAMSVEEAKEIESGRLIMHKRKLNRKDELGQLSHSFHDMKYKLIEVIETTL